MLIRTDTTYLFLSDIRKIEIKRNSVAMYKRDDLKKYLKEKIYNHNQEFSLETIKEKLKDKIKLKNKDNIYIVVFLYGFNKTIYCNYKTEIAMMM